MVNKVPYYLKEDFPAGKSGKTCQTLIRKVGHEAQNNILHPGYTVDQLDNQIKKIFKNLSVLE
jgi:hypothetical protein